jgi:hypothetical protein
MTESRCSVCGATEAPGRGPEGGQLDRPRGWSNFTLVTDRVINKLLCVACTARLTGALQ